MTASVWHFIGAGRERGQGGVSFKVRHWPDLRIHPMPVTCFLILLGSVWGTHQIFKSCVYTIRGLMERKCGWCEGEVVVTWRSRGQVLWREGNEQQGDLLVSAPHVLSPRTPLSVLYFSSMGVLIILWTGASLRICLKLHIQISRGSETFLKVTQFRTLV